VKVTKRDRIMLTILAAVVLVGGVWWMYIKPVGADASADRAQATQVQEQADGLRSQLVARLAHRSPGRAQTAQATAEAIAIRKAVPTSARVPELLVQLQRLAARASVRLDSIAPTASGARPGGLTAQGYTVTIKGGLFDVDDFLYRVQHLVRVRKNRPLINGRLIGMTKVDLQLDEEGGAGKVTATVSMLTLSGQVGAPTDEADATGTGVGG
jgi:Tfp pilus assembly protein PilO